jgi:hypothetical protein
MSAWRGEGQFYLYMKGQFYLYMKGQFYLYMKGQLFCKYQTKVQNRYIIYAYLFPSNKLGEVWRSVMKCSEV